MKLFAFPLILVALQAGGPETAQTAPDAVQVDTLEVAPIPAPIDVAPAEPSFDRETAILGAESALNAFSSATGRFMQIAPDGSISTVYSSGDYREHVGRTLAAVKNLSK